MSIVLVLQLVEALAVRIHLQDQSDCFQMRKKKCEILCQWSLSSFSSDQLSFVQIDWNC